MNLEHKSTIILVGILIFALSLRLYFYVGEGFTDDVESISNAYRASLGHPFSLTFLQGTSNSGIRMMTILPIALCFKLFGFKIASASGYFLFCSLSSIFLTYLIASHFFGKTIGMLAALFYAVFPLAVFYASQMSGDVAASFYLLLGLYVLIRKRPYWGGIVWGIGLAAKENGIFYIPVLLAYLFAQPQKGAAENTQSRLEIMRDALLGFSVIFSLELLVFYLVTGNPFHRWQIGFWAGAHVLTNTDLGFYPKYIVQLFPPYLGLFGFFVALLPVFIWIAYQNSDSAEKKKLSFFLLWFILICGYLEFGIMSTQFRPIEKMDRYWTILILPLVIFTAYGTSKLRKEFRLAFVLLLSLHSLWAVKFWVNMTRPRLAPYLEECRILKTLPRKIVYTDIEGVGRLFPLLEGKWEIRNFEYIYNEAYYSDCYLVLPAKSKLYRNSKQFPFYLNHPPSSWKQIAVIHPPNLPQLRPEELSSLYYIPPPHEALQNRKGRFN